MGSWRKVLISGSNAHIAGITASAITNTGGNAQSPGVEEKVLVYNTSSGAFYFTGSYGQGGSGGSGTPGGNNQNIQFNNGGAFDGDDGFIFNDSGDTSLFVDGPITGSIVSASGAISGSEVAALKLIARNTDDSANIALQDADGNNIAQLARAGTGAQAHKGRLVLRDNSTTVVNIEGHTTSYITNTSNNAKLGINTTTPGEELTVQGNVSASGKFIGSEISASVPLTGLTLSGNITASGNISASAGISASVATIVKDEDGGDVTLTVRNSNNDGGLDKNAGIVFGHSSGAKAGKILAGKETSYGGATSNVNSNLKFFTTEEGTDNERLRIFSNGNISASNALFISTSLSGSHAPNNVVLINTATGELYHTGSYGSGGGGTTPTLQQVTDQGSITTVAITSSAAISSSGDLSGNIVNSKTSYTLTDLPVIFPESGKFVFGQTAAVSYPIGVTRITGSHIEIPTPISSSIISASGTTFTKNLQFPQGASVANGGISFGSAGGDNGLIYDDGANLQLGYNDADVITIHDAGTNVLINGDLKTLSHITASGNISASGDLIANETFLDNMGSLKFANGTSNEVRLRGQNGDLFIGSSSFFGLVINPGDGHITSSGNISASGALFVSTSLSSSHTSNNVLLINTATGELYHTGSYGSGGGGGGGVVTGYTNGSNNRLITSTGTSTINGEGGLLFDSSTNLLQVGVSAANRVTLSGASGTVQTTSHVTIGDNSANTNVNAFLQFAPKSGGYYSGVFIGTDDMTSTFSADGRHTGEIIEAPVASSITAGDILYMRTTGGGVLWNQAIASLQASSTPMLAIGIDTTTTNRAMSRGYIRVAATQVLGPAPNLGQLLYVSTGSAGAFQTLPPQTSGHVVRSVGYPINSATGRGGSATSYLIYFNPSNDYIVA